METVNISLIDGVFNPEDAREILIDLINKKIHFHSLKSHENWERNGIKDTFSNNRIKELEAAREKILDLTKSSIPNEFKLRIKSAIEIEGLNEF
jgi:hypothetical protein